MLSFTFDTELYTYVTWMFMGVVALGFGFAYISRLGEVSTLFTEDFTQAKDAIIEKFSGGGGELEAIPEPVTSEDEMEEEVEIVEEEEEEIIEEETVSTMPSEYEYDLLLDPAVMKAIQDSLANTPHEGFKPVVSIAPNGNLKIDFAPL